MNEHEIKNADLKTQADTQSPTDQAAKSPWVPPTFERQSLKEAMSGTGPKKGGDIGNTYS